MKNKLNQVIQAMKKFPKKEITQEELEALIIMNANIIYRSSIRDYVISLLVTGIIVPKDEINYSIKV